MKSETLINNSSSKLKAAKVLLLPGEEVGEHRTNEKEELIIILNGNASLLKEGEEIKLNKGDIHYINENMKHNVVNNGDADLEYIYIVSHFN